jgi:hypothetical protein
MMMLADTAAFKDSHLPHGLQKFKSDKSRHSRISPTLFPISTAQGGSKAICSTVRWPVPVPRRTVYILFLLKPATQDRLFTDQYL